MNATKDETATDLARYHFEVEPTVRRVVRVRSSNEDSEEEPIKLLEVNSATVPAGIVPVKFGATDAVPFASVIIEITDQEYDQLLGEILSLPNGWRLAETLFEKA